MRDLIDILRRRKQWRNLRKTPRGKTFTTDRERTEADQRLIAEQWLRGEWRQRHSYRRVIVADDSAREYWSGLKIVLLIIVVYVVGHVAVTFIRWNF